MNRFNRTNLKDRAKDRLIGKYGLLIRVFILSVFLTLLATSITDSLFTRNSFEMILISEAATLIVAAFTGLFSIGSAFIYLKLAKGEDAATSDLFYAFSHNFQTSLGVSFLLGIISSIPTLAALALDLYQIYTQNVSIVLSASCTILAFCIYFVIHLFTAQCEFLLIDEPEKSVREIFSLSAKLMLGHKKELAFLIISFFPITLLAALSLIGVLWVIPYISMTYALYYLRISGKDDRDAAPAPQKIDYFV